MLDSLDPRALPRVGHLTNPANDAKLIAAAQKQDGFVVTHLDDLDRDSLAKALRAFGHEADGADWAVIYYAGHGIEMGGTNYLIPVDAMLETDRDASGRCAKHAWAAQGPAFLSRSDQVRHPARCC